MKNYFKKSLLKVLHFPLMFLFFTNTVAQNLQPPTIKAIPSDERVVITWEEVPGATGYNLYWGPRADINTFNMFTMKVPLVKSPFVQTQLANGITYYFIVQAINSKGSSYASNTASAIPKKPIIIRPFGDSITFGAGFADNTYCPVYQVGQMPCPTTPVPWGGGYRGWMNWISAFNPNFTFVTEGQQRGGSNLLQKEMLTSPHDGYPGYTTTQMVEKSNLPSNANHTLVHLGTNDIYWGYVTHNMAPAPNTSDFPVAPVAANLFELIKNILNSNLNTVVHVAQITKFVVKFGVTEEHVEPLNRKIKEYNDFIYQNWTQLPLEMKSRVKIVDIASALNSPDDYIDGIHPNKEGYLKMACTWIRSIKNIPANSNAPCSAIISEAIANMMPSN